MAAFSSIALGVAAAAGVVGSTIYSVNEQKKAARKQTQALEKQQQEAKETAREAARQQTTKKDTGARVKLGSDDSDQRTGTTSSTRNATRSGVLASSVGGLNASTKLGL